MSRLILDSGTLEWCLPNHPKLMDCPKQVPKVGSTDHYTVLIHQPQSSSTSKNTKVCYVYASDKPGITGKIKSLIAKRQKRLKFVKDSQAYKEAHNAVQKECENCKKCFYDRKVA